MSLNHHILAKTTTDAVLNKFKTVEWNCLNGYGRDFYRVGTNADFPSPDAAFYDPSNKILASFEFKPPTETKRGILTGVGQSIAYLQSCSISFLVAPKRLQDYDLGLFLTSLYAEQIDGKLPTGLILYDNDNPNDVELVQNVTNIAANDATPTYSEPKANRFWAKHLDMPVPLFHLLLHYYYLKKIGMIDGDPFATCWKERLISPTILEDFEAKPVMDVYGNPIITLGGRKELTILDKNLKKMKALSIHEKREKICRAIDTNFIGDNHYNSYRKNFVTFLKHLQVIDSENNLTDSGFNLYHIGLTNGPTSQVFIDYFTKEVLTTGHHLDLLLDLDMEFQKDRTGSLNEILKKMENAYEDKGYIKRNPNRMSHAESNVGFLKYERILWKALKLIDDNNIIQWKKVTEVCALPD